MEKSNRPNVITLPFRTALKRGMGPTTTIVGRLNAMSCDKVFTSTFVKHVREECGKKFPIGCYIQFQDTNNNESYGYYLNSSICIIDKWIVERFGQINIIGGSKRYPKEFLEYMTKNFPPTQWIKQKYLH